MAAVGQSKPRRKYRKRRSRVSKKTAKENTKDTLPPVVIEYISVPKHWFTDPLNHAMTTSVRPPTKLTRRKQQKIELRVPEDIFIELMQPVETGTIPDFKWIDETKKGLTPTSDRKTFLKYDYTIGKPHIIDAIWRLDEVEKKQRARRTRAGGADCRGHGSSRLHLSAAAALRGELSDLLSQVTGNVIMNFKVPKQSRAMPTLVIKFSVSTMDKNGNIEWANTYSAPTAAGLRNRMHHHLNWMKQSSQHPTLAHMSTEGGGDSVRPQRV